jgi:predicted amidophosphoribosyltransferase
MDPLVIYLLLFAGAVGVGIFAIVVAPVVRRSCPRCQAKVPISKRVCRHCQYRFS